MQTMAEGQVSAHVVFNEAMQTLEHQQVYGRRHAVTTGLTWGYYGGRWGGNSISDGTLTLTNSATNYVVVARSNGAASVSTATTNWNNTADYARVYVLTTSGGAVTAIEDHRAGAHGVHGVIAPPAAATVASASTIAIALGARVAVISGTTGITSITATGHSGAVVTLIFQGALTVTDGSNLKLAGNFTTAADATLTLACDGTNWYECGRSTN